MGDEIFGISRVFGDFHDFPDFGGSTAHGTAAHTSDTEGVARRHMLGLGTRYDKKIYMKQQTEKIDENIF